MKLHPEIKKVKDQIVKKYKPEKIILFGSFAYGIPNEHSDIDLLIIKKTKEARRERIQKVFESFESILPVEPLVYTPQELEIRLGMRDYFLQDAVNKGKVIYEQ